MFYGLDYVVYKFVEGEFILDWIRTANSEEIKDMLIKILDQCLEMDKLKLNKEEMHRPFKHILIDKQPVLLDFERCFQTEKPHNITQFLEFIRRLSPELSKKKIELNDLKEIAKQYKSSFDGSLIYKIFKR